MIARTILVLLAAMCGTNAAANSQESHGEISRERVDRRGEAEADRLNTATASISGVKDGYFYRWWTESTGEYANFTNGPEGSFVVQWSSRAGYFYGGKGWEIGTNRTISYTGSYRPSGYSQLGVYGITSDPLSEYFIVDDWGTYVMGPAIGRRAGTYTVDGSDYRVYKASRYYHTDETGATFSMPQVWAVRDRKRVGGNVTMASHLNAWAGFGIELGKLGYQVMAVEGYFSSGIANITVSSDEHVFGS